jgi:hypothetical protein
MKNDLENQSKGVFKKWIEQHSSSVLWLPILCFLIMFALQYCLMLAYQPIESDFNNVKTDYGLYTYKGNQDSRDSYLNGIKINCNASHFGVWGSCYEDFNNKNISIYFVNLKSIFGIQKYTISLNDPPVLGFEKIQVSKWLRLSYGLNFFISLGFAVIVFIFLISIFITFQD